MTENRIRSDLFVGREKELARFREILAPKSNVNVLNIHTNGDGGNREDPAFVADAAVLCFDS